MRRSLPCAAAALLTFLLNPVVTAQAPVEIRPGVFAAGIPTEQFQFFVARQQRTNWCWAASIQMVLNFHGLVVSQDQIVARVFGSNVDAPADPSQILASLSGWAFQINGRPASVSASPVVFQGSDIVSDLVFHWPLIVGVQNPTGEGHIYVLTAVTYSVGPGNQPLFISATLRDPWPTNPSRIEVPWTEFAPRVGFVARVRVQRL